MMTLQNTGSLLLILASLSISTASQAGCSPTYPIATPAVSEKFATETEAFARIQKDFGFSVKRSDAQSRCGGGVDYTIQAADGAFLDDFTVGPQGEYTVPTVLYGLLKVVHRTPVATLKELARASRELYQDILALEKEWGVQAYDPSATSDDYRFPQKRKQRLSVTMRLHGKKYYSSSDPLGEALIETSTYIFGRTDYWLHYQKGDLERVLFGDEKLLRAIVHRTNQNAKYQRESDRSYGEDWTKFQAKLRARLGEEKYAKLTVYTKGAEGSYEPYLRPRHSPGSAYGPTLECLYQLGFASNCTLVGNNYDCNTLDADPKLAAVEKKRRNSKKERDQEIELQVSGSASFYDGENHVFVGKLPGDGSVYILDESGLYRLRLDAKDYFLANQSMEKDSRTQALYFFSIGNRRLALGVARTYFTWGFHEEKVHLISSKDTPALESKCAVNASGQLAYDAFLCKQPKLEPLSTSEAQHLAATVARNELYYATELRELTDSDRSPDCSVWESIERSCGQSVLKDTAEIRGGIRSILRKARKLGRKNGNSLCMSDR